LANAVRVVEGATEVAVYLAVADVLDAAGTPGCQQPDLAGLTLFDAGSDSAVPGSAPVFAAMGKTVFGAHDTMKKPYTDDQKKQAESFAIHDEIPTWAWKTSSSPRSALPRSAGSWPRRLP
jgi:putative ATP-dependent endonuclease of OLD family